MTKSELRSLPKKERCKIADLLYLEDREYNFFILKYIDKLKISEMISVFNLSRHTLNHLSCNINKKIYNLDYRREL